MGNQCELAIIGGGAAGLCAAIAAARLMDNGKVIILERCDRVGKKLLATGNGRCNLSNTNASTKHYRGDAHLIGSVLERFDAKQTMAFFESLGVYCKMESEGRVYPYSDQASAVLDVLRLECSRLHVEERCNAEVVSIRKKEDGLMILLKDGTVLPAHRAIVCAGGSASPALGSNGSGFELLNRLGHELTPTYPALVQVKTKTDDIRSLKGIKFTGEAAVSVGGEILMRERGEVLFTEYGLSGIAILNLSLATGEAFAKGCKDVKIVLDLMSEVSEPECTKMLFARARALAHKPLEHYFTGLLNKRIGLCVLKMAMVPIADRMCLDLSTAEIKRITSIVKGWRIEAISNMGYANAQVTAGGIATSGFDPMTLQSRIVPGVYAAGEVLAVEGGCGGFNLQWAWASGHIAGEAAALSLLYSKNERACCHKRLGG